MTEEDEEFNRIEREASLRKAVVASAVAAQQKPMHPEIKKLYEDYFDKCFKESSVAERQWTGLTDEEITRIEEATTCLKNESWLRNLCRNIEAKLKEKNT